MDEGYSDYTTDFLVSENGKKYQNQLQTRLLQFAIDIIRFLFLLPFIKEMEVFRYQLSKSGTSIGANYQESQAGTYNEFRSRIQICLREAKETNYFLQVLKGLKLEETNYKFKKNIYTSELERLLKESDEIKRIFGSISTKTKKNKELKIKD